jgi:hypothetical protein
MCSQIICCVSCHRSIGNMLSIGKILEHQEMYDCKINQWMVFNNLQYLEYRLGQKELKSA